jgi:hypothetical protein
MKFPYFFLISALCAIIVSCEKVKITRGDIVGNWLFEKTHVDTVYYSGLVSDTTINYGNERYLINNSDTLSIYDIQYNSINNFIIEYQSPNTLLFYPCPLTFFCFHNIPTTYKILKANDCEMIWQSDYEWPNQKKKIINKLYFIK